jgi:hypothetical protein
MHLPILGDFPLMVMTYLTIHNHTTNKVVSVNTMKTHRSEGISSTAYTFILLRLLDTVNKLQVA